MQETLPIGTVERDEDRRRPTGLWVWLLWSVVVFCVLFSCGSLATRWLSGAPGEGASSKLSADYRPWPLLLFPALNPGFLQDLEEFFGGGTPSGSGRCLLIGPCTPVPSGTKTPTQTPTLTPTPTETPTNTPLPTWTLPPTRTSTATDTPTITPTPTNTPTPTPLVFPVKQANPENIPPGSSSVTFTILVINYGSLPPANLTRVIDRLPPNMTYAGVPPGFPAPTSVVGNEITWDVNMTIPQSGFVRFRFVANVAGAIAGDVLQNEVETQGGNFATATNWKRVYVYTPTPTPTNTGTPTPTATNSAPVAVNDGPVIVQGGSFVDINVVFNDTDIDGNLDPASAAPFPPPTPAKGSAIGNGDGTIRYAPNVGATGSDSFGYRVSDLAAAQSNTAIVQVSINYPPTVTDDSTAPCPILDAANDYCVDEDTTLVMSAAFGVLSNDSDPDLPPDTLSAVLVAAPPATEGVVALSPNGSFTFTPAPNFNGATGFTYEVSDGRGGLSSIASVTITVVAVDDFPIANTEEFRFPLEDTVLSVPAPGVLSNDTGLGDTPLVLTVVDPPARGSVVLNSDGSYVYTPFLNENGLDSFTYVVTDVDGDVGGQPLCGGWPAPPGCPATVPISLLAVNDAPVAGNDAYAVDEDDVLLVADPGVLVNDSDAVEGTALTAVQVSPPANGVLVLNFDGSFSYTPNPNYRGPDSFTYQARDSGTPLPTQLSNLATVSITVNSMNDTPVASPDGYTATEDTLLVVPVAAGVFANDTGLVDTPVTATLEGAAPPGTLTLNSDGSFTYMPPLDYSSPPDPVVTFDYRVTDFDGEFAIATVTVTVNPANDPPVAHDDSVTTPEDTPITVDVLNIPPADYDPDGSLDPASVTVISGPGSGTITNINPATGEITYLPNFNYYNAFDPDTFTYRVCDDGPGVLCDTAVVSVFVTAVNDPPSAGNDTYRASEFVPRVVAAPGVLGDDNDPDGPAPMTAVLVVGPAFDPTFVLNLDGSFTYTYSGVGSAVDSFTYTACDPTPSCDLSPATVTLNVNDDPVAADDPTVPGDPAYSVDEDGVLFVGAPGVLGNDSDPNLDPLSAGSPIGPTFGSLVLNPDGSFTYTPDAEFNGTDQFDYDACDPAGPPQLCDTATVTIIVNAVNDAPVASDDGLFTTNQGQVLNVPAAGVLSNDTDVELDPLTASLVTGPSSAQSFTLNPDGSFSYDPAPGFFGGDSFTYQAFDGADFSNVAIVTIRVNAPPIALDDPASTPDPNYEVDEDSSMALAAPGVLANDNDPDGDLPLTAVLAGPAPAGLSFASDGSFTYSPPANFNGIVTFGYRACDALGLCSTGAATVTITVNPVNDDPVASNDAYSGSEFSVLAVGTPGVLENDNDIDGDPLVANLLSPLPPELQWYGDGSFDYTPSGPGVFTFVYEACDPSGACNMAAFMLTINDPPTANPDGPYTTDEDTSLVVAAPGVLGNDVELNTGQIGTLTATPTGGPSFAQSFTLNSDGSFSYTPNANYYGPDSFTYDACDPMGACDGATVSITVNSINDLPVAQNDSGSTNQETPVTVNVLANDSDIDGSLDLSSVVIVSPPANGSITGINPGTGAIEYTPNSGPFSSDAFDYTVADNLGGVSNSATVTISINPPVIEVIKEVEVAPDPASVGQTVTFTIYVINNGPGPAYGLDLTDTLGSCFSFIGPDPSGSLGDFAEGGAAVFLFDAQVVSNTSCTNSNTATVTSLNASAVSDTASVSITGMSSLRLRFARWLADLSRPLTAPQPRVRSGLLTPVARPWVPFSPGGAFSKALE